MYFDFTATTKMDEDILKTYVDIQSKYYANTTSLHMFGQKCNNIYEQMKDEIRNILNVNGDIIFTSNATEANNLSIFGLTSEKKGKIITTKIEHPSVYEVMQSLEKNGYEVVYLDVLDNGIIDLNQFKKEMNKDVILVSIMWVNNIIGSIQPIDKIIEILNDYPKARLHVDAVQGMCKIKPTFDFNKIDAFTISAHKFYGPKGVGAIILKKGITLNPRLYGSKAQYGIKPGTFDLGLVVCLTKALKKYYNLVSKHYDEVLEKYNFVINNINNKNVVINSKRIENGSPYIINISVPKVYGETVVHLFEAKGIFISTGSACSSKENKAEKTIYAITKDEKLAKSTVRISLSHLTTTEELNELLSVINNI